MNYVCAGQIGRPIGIKGYAIIHSFMSSTQSFLSFKNHFYWESGIKVNFVDLKVNKNNKIIGKLGTVNSEIDLRNEIEKFKFQKLFIKRSDLPDLNSNEYYYCDLIGLLVCDKDGNPLGKVQSVHNYGAGDFLEILLDRKTLNQNTIATVPFNKDAILEVQKEKIIINPDFILV